MDVWMDAVVWSEWMYGWMQMCGSEWMYGWMQLCGVNGCMDGCSCVE